MTLEEINSIEDIALREIRLKYWNLLHKVFLDEHGIPDHKLGSIVDELTAEENREIAAYLSKKKQ